MDEVVVNFTMTTEYSITGTPAMIAKAFGTTAKRVREALAEGGLIDEPDASLWKAIIDNPSTSIESDEFMVDSIDEF